MENSKLFSVLVMLIYGLMNDDDLSKEDFESIMDKGVLKEYVLDSISNKFEEGFSREYILRMVEYVYDEIKMDLDIGKLVSNYE